MRATSRLARHYSTTAERPELHAAWASLAAYDSDAVGQILLRQAVRAKKWLARAGFELIANFTVTKGQSLDFEGTREVTETDAAYL